jgi:CBS domain-containing protein
MTTTRSADHPAALLPAYAARADRLLMLDSGVSAVPIVDDEALVGIVSRRDVLRFVARRELTSEDVRQRRTGSGPAAAVEPTRLEGART